MNARTAITVPALADAAPGRRPERAKSRRPDAPQGLDAGVVPTDPTVNGVPSYPPYRRIYESGTRACLGSGAPGEAPYPRSCTSGTRSAGRSSIPNRGGVAAEQRLTRERALALATRRCDWFMGLDGRIGALEPGRLADLIVLSRDYFRVPLDEIPGLTWSSRSSAAGSSTASDRSLRSRRNNSTARNGRDGRCGHGSRWIRVQAAVGCNGACCSDVSGGSGSSIGASRSMSRSRTRPERCDRGEQ